MTRVPALANVGIRQFFCGPESFTPDIKPMLGPAPEIDGFFVAAGLNSLGILRITSYNVCYTKLLRFSRGRFTEPENLPDGE